MAASQMLSGHAYASRGGSKFTFEAGFQREGPTYSGKSSIHFPAARCQLLSAQRAARCGQGLKAGLIFQQAGAGVVDRASKRGPVRMVLGSGGRQQKRSQQSPAKAPSWHPLEDLPLASQDEPAAQKGKPTPAEGARTFVADNKEGLLFTRMFPEGHSEGLDLSYLTDDQGDLYFTVDGIDWDEGDPEYLQQEDITVVVGCSDYDEGGMLDEVDEEMGDYPFSDSDYDDDDDDEDSDSDDEDWEMVDEYLSMLRSRGVPVEDMSAESFGTLGAYGGLDTLETVHPLDFAIRLSDTVEAQGQLEVAVPQAQVTLRGVVELVSPDELDPHLLERVKRGLLARTEEAHPEDAAMLQEEGEEQESALGEAAASDEAAQERADAALEQLRQDLQNPETRAGGSARAAALFETSSLEAEDLDLVESHAQPPDVEPVSKPSTSTRGADDGVESGSSSTVDREEPAGRPNSHVKALLRGRLKALNGFPKPKSSRGEEQAPEVAESRGDAGGASRREDGIGDETALNGGDECIQAEGGSVPKDGAREASCTSVGASEPHAQAELRGHESTEDRGPGNGADTFAVEESGHAAEPETSAAAAIQLSEEADEQSRAGRAPEALPCSTSDVAVEDLRQDRGAEASTSGSEPHASQVPKPADLGGIGRWLTSLTSKSPIIWDQNTGRLWLGGGGQLGPGDGLGNGTHSLGSVLWGNDEDADVDSLWRDSDDVEDNSVVDDSWPEGPPLYRLRVTSVAFKSPAGVEWQVDASEYAAAQPDVLRGASANMMEQVNHAGHKVARALVRLCKRTLGVDVDDAEMVAVDRYGFDLRVSQGIEMKTLRVSFPEIALDEDHAMLLLEDMMWLNRKPGKKIFHFRRSGRNESGGARGS